MAKVKFELYSEEMFFELEIETENVKELLSILLTVPNVRHITIER